MATSEQPDLDRNFTKGRFTDRVFIVTGGASGIGLATAERLCNDGGNVAVLDYSEENGKEAESLLKSKGYSARYYSGDVSNKASCEEAVKKVVAQYGPVIHGLVNCAICVTTGEQGVHVSEESWDATFATTIKGTSQMVQCCLPYMKNAEGCAIVNLSSITGTRPLNSQWPYCTTKAALESLTRCMALDLNQYGIRANSVAPGVTWTPGVKRWFDSRQTAENFFNSTHIMNRLGEASEIAAAITFLLSKDASFMTGTTMYVDGGSNAKSPSVK